MQILPSIVPEDFLDVESKLRQLEALSSGLIEWAHLDISDGRFTKNKTWPYTEEDMDQAIKDFGEIKTSLKLGLHMMVRYPDDQLDEWIDTPLSRIAIHDEIYRNKESLLAILDMSKCESGIVLKMESNLDDIAEVVDEIDTIQLMSINKLGSYGAEFDDRVFGRIAEVKERFPDKHLTVDGGVKEHNIKQLADAGVDAVVVGSAIWKSDNIEDAISNLTKAIK